MSNPEPLRAVVSRNLAALHMLHDALQLHAQRNLLMSVERKLRALHGFCEGCDSPLSRCGPELWKEQRKCCPDCTHGRLIGG